MLQNIRFRDCIHRGIVGPTPEAALAAVLGEICAPIGSPIEAETVFAGTARVLGKALFSAVWTAYRGAQGTPMPDPRGFAEFLGRTEPGSGLPQLIDQAQFDLAVFLAAQPSPSPSVGACCLPTSMLRDHPEMVLRFQPGWRYLRLSYPVHRVAPDSLSVERLSALTGPQAIDLRVGSDGDGVSVVELSPASFVLQSELRTGRRLAEAAKAAQAVDPMLDVVSTVAALVAQGAIIDAVLHSVEIPITRPQSPNPELPRGNP